MTFSIIAIIAALLTIFVQLFKLNEYFKKYQLFKKCKKLYFKLGVKFMRPFSKNKARDSDVEE